MTIAVLGGGILGCCTALELADRGFQVILFERNSELVTEASRFNEGKLHLGFVYAADPTFRTAMRMIRGAAQFMDIMSRWVPAHILRALPSHAFDYAVHRDTMVPIDAIERHYARVSESMRDEMPKHMAFPPFDPSLPMWRKRSAAELETHYNPEVVRAVYATCEIAVDPWLISAALQSAVNGHPRVECRMSTTVARVADRSDGAYDVWLTGSGSVREGPFDAVVNALWANRAAVDARYGIAARNSMFVRQKLGVNFLLPNVHNDIPTTTLTLGPYGDVVRYQSGRVYLSWYPDCMIGTSTGHEETNWSSVLAAVDVARVQTRTIDALGAFIPAIRQLTDARDVTVVVNGGSIFALGSSDIDDLQSRLHERIDQGVDARDRYLSVDTSKYTLGPAQAIMTANHVSRLVNRAGRA